MLKRTILTLLLALPLIAGDRSDLLFVGTYTNIGTSKGIYVYRFNPATGDVSPLGLAAPADNPSFLTADVSGKYLYAVNELDTYRGEPTGAVSTFAIDRATGRLKQLQERSSLGKAPAHLSLDHSGRCVLVANYDSGNVAVFPVRAGGTLGEHTAFDQHTGSGVNPARQEGPHAHSILTSNDNRFALSADLGIDELLVYRFDAEQCSLARNTPPFAKVQPGSGPRHFTFLPSSKWLYLANEMGGTITIFAYDASQGAMTTAGTVRTLAPSFKGDNREAEIALGHDSRFLYVSNRGEDSIVVFAVDADRGNLTFVQRVPSGGRNPRHFAIDPTGRWLFCANQDTNNIQLFRIDPASGKLSAASAIGGISAPVCVLFVPAE